MKAKRLLSVLLAGLLHFMPLVRQVIWVEARAWAPSAWAWVLKLAGGSAALLGSYEAVSGATQIVTPYTVNGTLGVAYSRQLTTSGQTAHSWSASTAPLGSPAFPLTPGLWLTNSNGRIGGVPAWAGTSNITIKAWENSGNSGASVSALFVFTIVNPAGSPPVITLPPQSQTNYVGSAAIFSVTASSSSSLSYQWTFQGTNLPGATASSYTVNPVVTASGGPYAVALTNAAGVVTSSPAMLTVLPPSADVATTLSGPANAYAGTPLGFVITLTNQGPTAASNVVVSDSFPAGLVFVGATGGGVAGNGVVTWPALTALPKAGSTNFTVTFTAPVTGALLTNTAASSASTPDPNAANNNGSAPTAIALTTITPQADVMASCTGPANVLAGGPVTYTVAVSNAGPSTASNLVVSDVLPSAAAFVAASTGGIANNGVVTWPLVPSLSAGATVNFSLTVTAPGSGTLTNLVSSSASTFDPASGNNNGSAAAAIVTTTVQPQADVAVLVTGPSGVLPGSNLTYTITVTNVGPSAANNVAVTEALPPAAGFVSATGGGVPAAGTVTWPTIANLPSGSTATFSVTVTAPTSGILTNRVSGSAATADPVPGNNNGSAAAAIVVTTVSQLADLAVSCSGPTVVAASSNLTYTITVSNLGPSVASAVVVTDLLPPTAGFLSATGGGTSGSGTVTWPTIASLASGASTTFNLTVTAPGSGILTNRAAGSSATFDPVAANNDGSTVAAQAITAVGQQADLAVFATGPAAVLPGSNLVCAITVSNLGPSTASNVVVSDALSPTLALVSTTGGGIANGGVVTWPAMPSLASGAGTTFSVTLTAPASGTVSNVASATSSTLDPVAANNNGTAPASRLTTSIAAQADIVAVCGGPTAVVSKSTFSYTITLTNLGSSTASNLLVADALPATVVFVSASGGGAVNNGIVSWPPLTSLVFGATATFSVTVTAPAGGLLTNRVSSTSTTLDPTPSNNDGTATGSGVVTTVNPQADLAVSISGPTTVVAGSNFTCTVTVTDLGPSPATNVVVSDALPAGALFVSASGGGTPSAGTVVWPPLPWLNPGQATNFTLTLKVPGASSVVSTALASNSTPDPNLANNNGTQPASQLAIAVLVSQFGILGGSKVLNPQTGLYEQVVTITNISPNTVAAVRLLVTGLRTGVQLYNAAGTEAGAPFVQYNSSVNPAQAVSLLLEFYVPDRLGFSDSFQAEAVLPALTTTNAGQSFPISRAFIDSRLGASRFAIEFGTVISRTYTVIYSDDTGTTWNVATPSITASATSTQWYDDGPPKTVPPPNSGLRMYRVIGTP